MLLQFFQRRPGAQVLFGLLILALTGSARAGEEPTPAEVAIGERLFLETRFSFPIDTTTDRVMEHTQTIDRQLPGPFRGQSMNCRSCHLVDEQVEARGGGMRTYSDFARRSPIAARADGARTSVRNSQQLVDIARGFNRNGLFHYDGEFASMEDLVLATLTGRNFGWLPGEYDRAVTHIASVIRNDDGTGKLAQEFGGQYVKVLTGTAGDLPNELRLPANYRVDVKHVSDQQIVHAIASLIAAYVNDIQFSRNDKGEFDASPYDAFLKANKLPAKPALNESPMNYSRRLLRRIEALKKPIFIRPGESSFKLHTQAFQFGELELKGLKIFFAENGSAAGNCIQCHQAPAFSDFGFHNTGVTQAEYDSLHGEGSFNRLTIPNLQQRQRDYNAWMPATPHHPQARQPYRSVASRSAPGRTDLGLWNVFANPDMPRPQATLQKLLCAESSAVTGNGADCTPNSLLPKTVARFKTPVLRDLGHSAPYMHNGALDTVEAVLAFYIDASEKAHRGQLRNPAPQLNNMKLSGTDIVPLTAFINSLNEDYE